MKNNNSNELRIEEFTNILCIPCDFEWSLEQLIDRKTHHHDEVDLQRVYAPGAKLDVLAQDVLAHDPL